MHHCYMYTPYWCVDTDTRSVCFFRAQVQHTITVADLSNEANIVRARVPARSILRAHAAACMLQHADALRDAYDAAGMDMRRIAERTDRVRRRM